MYSFIRKWTALLVVLCLVLPIFQVSVGAEDEAEENPEGVFTIEDDQPVIDEDFESEDDEDTEPDDDEEEVWEDFGGEFETAEDAEDTEDSEDSEDSEDEDEEELLEIESVVPAWERPEDMGNVPLYLQTDYPDVPYGSGSVATSGCTMACIAMVATYLTGDEVTPDELAIRFRNADGSHIQRMEAASIIMDLSFKKTYYPFDVVRALEKGKVAIIMVGPDSDFTKTQHLMVLTEILPNGRIMVNDPMGKNYKKDELREGFTYGFTQEQLFKDFSGAWIYDFYTPPQVGPTQYPGLTLTDAERDMLAKLVWREARGECFEGQQAVAEVVLNRVISERFPTKDVISTIMAQDQFLTAKFMKDTVADELQYKAVDRALSGPNILPTNVYYFSRTARNSNIWGQIGNHVFCGTVW